MHPLEAAMKADLDGTFTRLCCGERGPRSVTSIVAADFLPAYDAPREQKQAATTKGVIKKPWSPRDDRMLLELRAAGTTWNACTGLLQRGIKQCRARYAELTQGGAA